MEENIKKKEKNNMLNGIIIGFLVGICFIMFLTVVYILFIKNPDKKEGNGPVKTSVPASTENVVELKRITLDSTDKTVKLKNGTINVKNCDLGICVNSKSIYTSDGVGDGSIHYEVFSSDVTNYALISEYSGEERSIRITGAINSKGEFVKVNYHYVNGENSDTKKLEKIYLKDGKIYGKYFSEEIDSNKKYGEDIEFIIDND